VKPQEREREVVQLNTMLEQRVSERTAALEADNRELEAFSYSVAHDLRAPIRTIDGFTALLLEETEGDLGDEARRHLDCVRNAAQRMSKLIDDLLALARVVRTDCALEQLNLSAIAADIGNEMRAANPGRSVEFINQAGVMVRAERTLAGVVLYNLLSTRGSSRRALTKRVSNSVRSNEGPELLRFVRDSGVGSIRSRRSSCSVCFSGSITDGTIQEMALAWRSSTAPFGGTAGAYGLKLPQRPARPSGLLFQTQSQPLSRPAANPRRDRTTRLTECRLMARDRSDSMPAC
jgi:light-regulated signal transduction histidine kinase (bacteriophytochrome)